MSEMSRIDALRPADTLAYMTDAWLGCLHFAAGDPDIIAAFRAATGNNWTPGRNGLERAIDDATGVERDFIEAFIQWVNVNVWGPMDGPKEAE